MIPPIAFGSTILNDNRGRDQSEPAKIQFDAAEDIVSCGSAKMPFFTTWNYANQRGVRVTTKPISSIIR
jgi:hypothetical protein